MRRFLFLIVIVPVTALIVALAVANRREVLLSLDPLHADHPALSVSAPLFVIVFGALVLGLVIGGLASWLSQGRWRRAARRAEVEAARLRLENARLRQPQGALPPARDAA